MGSGSDLRRSGRGLRAHESPGQGQGARRRVAPPLRCVAEGVSRTWPRTGTAHMPEACSPVGRRRCRRFDPADKPKLATRSAGAEVMEAFKRFTPTMVGGAADLVESTKTAFDGGGVFSSDLGRPEHAVRNPRTRDGRDRERHGGSRRHRQALRVDVPHLQRLHARRGAAVRTHEPSCRLGVDARLDRARRGRTRLINRSSTTPPCARSRTSG